MKYVVYRRLEAEVNDIRVFKDLDELYEWFNQQLKLEPTIILAILDKADEIRNYLEMYTETKKYLKIED